jgi:CubicO group peptidase (beta-lactamase class C family)
MTIKGQTYNFSAVDNLLNANLSTVFRNKLVCMVVQGDKLIYYYNRGGADSLTTGLIASATKTMSGTMILRLAQEGVLRLDDPIEKYYPFALALGKGKITIRQLFAHTSGLAGSTNFNSNANITLQQSADSIIRKNNLIYAPIGTKFSYTGEDQQVAGAIAELAARMRFDSLFDTKIGKPLGLRNTTFALTTPSNPRVAGGISSSATDMIRFGQFVLNNGKNNRGKRVVDSIWMQELWKDQTNRALQVSSPYPNKPTNNNPYNQDTIYYGFGSWLDIYNPMRRYQEQISADGAFGGIIWINRCTNTVGVFLTFLPSNFNATYPIQYKVMDIFRTTVPFNCYQTTRINEVESADFTVKIYPNPASNQVTIVSDAAFEKVSIFNVVGENLATISTQSKFYDLDISFLSKGIYFIKIFSNNKAVTQKLVVKE